MKTYLQKEYKQRTTNFEETLKIHNNRKHRELEYAFCNMEIKIRQENRLDYYYYTKQIRKNIHFPYSIPTSIII